MKTHKKIKESGALECIVGFLKHQNPIIQLRSVSAIMNLAQTGKIKVKNYK